MTRIVNTLLLLALFLFAGCRTLGTQVQTAPPAASSAEIEEARKLIKGRQYPDALSVLEKALQQKEASAMVPEIRYLIATIYVAADNPQKDYAEAFTEFDEFVHLYPDHDRAVEAKSWRQAIKSLLDARKENERLHKTIEGLKQLDVRQEQKRMGK